MKSLVVRFAGNIIRGCYAGRGGLAPFLKKSCFFAFLFCLTLLLGCGGGSGAIPPSSSGGGGSTGSGGSGGNGGSAGSRAVMINLGDVAAMPADSGPTADQIVSFKLTIESVAVRSSNGGV